MFVDLSEQSLPPDVSDNVANNQNEENGDIEDEDYDAEASKPFGIVGEVVE